MKYLIATALFAAVALRGVAQSGAPLQPGPEASLAAANAAARKAESQPQADPEPVQELFRAAVAAAQGPLLLRAANDYGVFLLRRSLYNNALSVFRGLETRAHDGAYGDAGLRARFFYNYGRALEASGISFEASSRYLDAVRLDGTFSDARDAAIANLRTLAARYDLASAAEQDSASPLADGLSLCEVLLARHDLGGVKSLLSAFVVSAGRSPRGEDLFLGTLVEYLTIMRTDPGEFEKRWLPPVAKLPPSRQLSDLRRAYEDAADALPLTLRPHEADAVFAGWTDQPGRTRFSALLRVIGDALAAQKLRGAALRRYALAFSLDPGNLDAASYVANLLLSYPAELDPQKTVVEQWTQALISSKLGAYSQDNWRDVLRLHTVLASIFEREGQLGPETEFRTASYHWLRALEAERQLATSQPGSQPAPVLHEKMAKFYADTHRPQSAIEQFLAGSDEFQALGETARAVDLQAAARPYEEFATDAQKQRIETGVKIGSLIGSWSTETTAWLRPDLPHKTHGTLDAAWSLDGRYISAVHRIVGPEHPWALMGSMAMIVNGPPTEIVNGLLEYNASTGTVVSVETPSHFITTVEDQLREAVPIVSSTWSLEGLDSGLQAPVLAGSCDAACQDLTLTSRSLAAYPGGVLTDITHFIDPNSFKTERFLIGPDGHAVKIREIHAYRQSWGGGVWPNPGAAGPP